MDTSIDMTIADLKGERLADTNSNQERSQDQIDKPETNQGISSDSDLDQPETKEEPSDDELNEKESNKRCKEHDEPVFSFDKNTGEWVCKMCIPGFQKVDRQLEKSIYEFESIKSFIARAIRNNKSTGY